MTIEHSFSISDGYTDEIININEDQQEETVLANAGLQLHSFERRRNPHGGKRNARRAAAIVFIVIGVGIACGPYILSKYQQKVVSYNQSATGPVEEIMPSDPAPTFNPSVLISVDDVESDSPLSASKTTQPKSEMATSIQPSSNNPTATPFMQPKTAHPSNSPTFKPTSFPTSREPMHSPSNFPTTSEPTGSPTTNHPTSSPSMHPTTSNPSNYPTFKPTNTPTHNPTSSPTTREPTQTPSTFPTTPAPTSFPTTSHPTSSPSMHPTTAKPSFHPTFKPTSSPSMNPTSFPTTREPTHSPTNSPTSSTPTSSPTTSRPTSSPSMHPTTANPSSAPTHSPTNSPTKDPNSCPSPACVLNTLVGWLISQTMSPTMQPTTADPTSHPSMNPTSFPTMSEPTHRSTNSPITSYPTSSNPTLSPSMSFSRVTTLEPSRSSSIEYTASLSPSSSSPSSPNPSSMQPTQGKDVVITMAPTSELKFDGFPAQNATSNTRNFSSQLRITFDGLSELMDRDASEVLEDTTLSYLNEQFLGLILVNKVTLTNQSVVHQASEPIRSLRVGQHRTLPKTGKNKSRSLAATSSPFSLIVELDVEGMITNLTAFSSGSYAQQISGDSISTFLGQSISSNLHEFMDRLEGANLKAIPSALVTDPVSSNESKGRKIFFIFGVTLAVAAMAGAIYMEIKSNVERRRQYDCDEDDVLSRDAEVGGDLLASICEAEYEVAISFSESGSADSRLTTVRTGGNESKAEGSTSENDSVSENQSGDESNGHVKSDEDSILGEIEEGDAEVERSAISSCTTPSGDKRMLLAESMSKTVARVRSLTSTFTPKSVDRQPKRYDAYDKKQSEDDMSVPQSGEDGIDDDIRHSGEKRNQSIKNDEVKMSNMTSKSEVTTPELKSSYVGSMEKQVANAMSCEDYRRGEDRSECDEENCQRGDHDEKSCHSDEQEYLARSMTTPEVAPTGDRSIPPAKQKSTKQRKSKPNKGKHERYECMEHTAYEVVLHEHH